MPGWRWKRGGCQKGGASSEGQDLGLPSAGGAGTYSPLRQQELHFQFFYALAEEEEKVARSPACTSRLPLQTGLVLLMLSPAAMEWGLLPALPLLSPSVWHKEQH